MFWSPFADILFEHKKQIWLLGDIFLNSCLDFKQIQTSDKHV